MSEKELQQLLRELLPLACGTPDAIKPGTDRLKTGILDSLGLIILLDELADRGIEIQPTQVELSRFSSLEGIVALCREALEQQGPAGQ